MLVLGEYELDFQKSASPFAYFSAVLQQDARALHPTHESRTSLLGHQTIKEKGDRRENSRNNEGVASDNEIEVSRSAQDTSPLSNSLAAIDDVVEVLSELCGRLAQSLLFAVWKYRRPLFGKHRRD